jgi:hypothetical protein
MVFRLLSVLDGVLHVGTVVRDAVHDRDDLGSNRQVSALNGFLAGTVKVVLNDRKIGEVTHGLVESLQRNGLIAGPSEVSEGFLGFGDVFAGQELQFGELKIETDTHRRLEERLEGVALWIVHGSVPEGRKLTCIAVVHADSVE